MGGVAIEYRPKSTAHVIDNEKVSGTMGNSGRSHRDRSKVAISNIPPVSVINQVVCYSGRSTRSVNQHPHEEASPTHYQASPGLLPRHETLAYPQVQATPIARQLYRTLQSRTTRGGAELKDYRILPHHDLYKPTIGTTLDHDASPAGVLSNTTRHEARLDYGQKKHEHDDRVDAKDSDTGSLHTSHSPNEEHHLPRVIKRIVSPATSEYTAYSGGGGARDCIYTRRVVSPTASEHTTNSTSSTRDCSCTIVRSVPKFLDHTDYRPLQQKCEIKRLTHQTEVPRIIKPTIREYIKAKGDTHAVSNIRQTSPFELSTKKILAGEVPISTPRVSSGHHHVDKPSSMSAGHHHSSTHIWENGRLRVAAESPAFSALIIQYLNQPKLSKTWEHDSSVKGDAGFDPFEGDPPRMPEGLPTNLPASYLSRLMAVDSL